jgi:ribosome-associated translation inhibitor RaiA
MELEIRRHKVRLDESMEEHIRRRVDFALGQFDSKINEVLVHVEDVNGPRGGIDKQCRILVSLRGGKTVKVEDLDSDLVPVIDRALDRAGHTVSKELAKIRDHSKRKPARGEPPL